MINYRGNIKIVLVLTLVAFCLFESALRRHSNIYNDCEVAFLTFPWMVVLCLSVWCGTFLFLTFRVNDVSLIVLLVVVIAANFFGASVRPAADTLTFLTGVTVGKSVKLFLKVKNEGNDEVSGSLRSGLDKFLFSLVMLVAFSSWWHLDMADNFYQGPRWMGFWNNPNIYGMLMSAGLVLAVGLLAVKRMVESGKQKAERDSSCRPFQITLYSAAGMMGVGLLFSYSRGSWLGAVVGLLYLAKAYGKLEWRFILLGIAVVTAVVCVFWSATPDSAPWYVKRLDFGRASAQHRVAAWRGALQMMLAHPFGVGWNRAQEIYEKNYTPPENGAAAITTNDYFMLGTQLGVPGLACFVSYVVLCFKQKCPYPFETTHQPGGRGKEPDPLLITPHSSRVISCRAGTLAMLVAFWFDGGLFTLATAAVFWILLELGSE